MEPLKSRKAQPYLRPRDPTQASRVAQYDERSARGARGRPKSYAHPAPQVAPPSPLRHYGRSANNSRPRRMKRYHPYDRQPQHVAIPEDEEDGEMVYHDEEPSYDEEFGDLEDPQDPQHDNKYDLENLIKAQSKATFALNRQLPQRFKEEISTIAGAQANFQAQGSTGRGAPFQMGLESTVDPSSLTSNTRGNGNHGS
ncbi:hypothetical protein FAGAP_892 [Fusarium agapanthi]|uniref:Uncharacterized protein n=1 Tax=Fusarium agapanthi TaxID=1803897 RepID=A0A9P5BIK6_9HYPO|nr:hypothetical protein FAGAP_892 [Fusarium agapanthi]